MITILQQPDSNVPHAGYRPVWFVVEASQWPFGTGTDACPLVMADLYYYLPDGMEHYHGSVSCSLHWDSGLLHLFYIDIQDKVQEVLSTVIPPYGSSTGSMPGRPIARFFVRFRDFYVDSNGILLSPHSAPVAETFESDAEGGGGIQSVDFYVGNSSIQADEEYSFSQHLVNWRPAGTVQLAYNLSHRPQPQQICKSDYDLFAVHYGAIKPAALLVTGQYKNGTAFAEYVSVSPPASTDWGVYYVAGGYEVMSTTLAAIIWQDVASYTVMLCGLMAGLPIPLGQQQYVLDDCACQSMRVIFLNTLGGWDAKSFDWNAEATKAISEPWQRPLPPGWPAPRTSRGISRQQPKQADEWTVMVECDEAEMAWLKELVGTPTAYLQWDGGPHVTNERNAFLPIVVEDVEINTKKPEERYAYEVTIKFLIANRRKNLRN